MKLKTLKDLFELFKKDYRVNQRKKSSGPPLIKPGLYKGIVNYEVEDFNNRIKQEAIKWVIHGLKYHRNFFKVFTEFHNITEEDLK